MPRIGPTARVVAAYVWGTWEDSMKPLVTTLDDVRLRSLLDTPIAGALPGVGRRLRRKLNRARLVAPKSVPPTVVTMNSRVTCLVTETGAERDMTLVYPWTLGPPSARATAAGIVSVLSLAGIELLGAVPGRRVVVDGIPWSVLLVAFQPEASGNYFL